jgi:hypothetical protein
MKNSNLAIRMEEFADVVSGIDARDPRLPRIVAAMAITESPPPPRPVPARRRIQIRDQGLRHFRVF